MAKLPGTADRVPLRWVGDSREALCEMPEEVREDFGRRLGLAQRGRLPPDTKAWQGLGPGVFEMFEEFDGDAYRAVYLARFNEVIYVLHAFQKKASKGRKTNQLDVQAIQTAHRSAVDDYKTDFKTRMIRDDQTSRS